MLVSLVFWLLAAITVNAQSDESLTPFNQVNLMVADEVASSPAFVSRSQFYNAFLTAHSSFPNHENITALNIFSYPAFINTAIGIANISSQTEMAMYLAQVFYETNGLTFRVVEPCSSLSNCTVCKNYTETHVNNTGGVEGKNYFGRGHLFIQNATEYAAVSQALFNDTRLVNNPNMLVNSVDYAWASAAWKWRTYIKPILGASDAFGLTTKYLRPWNCNVAQSGNQTEAATTAFNIYTAVLSAFAPNETANAAGCFS